MQIIFDQQIYQPERQLAPKRIRLTSSEQEKTAVWQTSL